MKPFGLIEKAFFLKKVRVFSELDLELLLAISEKLHSDEYDQDEMVFTSGHVANRLYLIVDGEVAILDERMHPIKKLGRYELFGDEALFSQKPRGYPVRCLTDALLLTLSRSHLLSIISECPSVAVAFLQFYSEELPCRHLKILEKAT